jgi:methyl-accepting chemotaxis protein
MSVFEVVASTVSMVAIIPLGYVAVQSMREARNLLRIQEELTALVVDTKSISEEVHRLQRELRTEQDAAKAGIDETQRTVEHATGIIEETAEKMTEVASGTQALASAGSDDQSAVAAADPRDEQPRRAPHLPQLRRRTRAQARRDPGDRA